MIVPTPEERTTLLALALMELGRVPDPRLSDLTPTDVSSVVHVSAKKGRHTFRPPKARALTPEEAEHAVCLWFNRK